MCWEYVWIFIIVTNLKVLKMGKIMSNKFLLPRTGQEACAKSNLKACYTFLFLLHFQFFKKVVKSFVGSWRLEPLQHFSSFNVRNIMNLVKAQNHHNFHSRAAPEFFFRLTFCTFSNFISHFHVLSSDVSPPKTYRFFFVLAKKGKQSIFERKKPVNSFGNTILNKNECFCCCFCEFTLLTCPSL